MGRKSEQNEIANLVRKIENDYTTGTTTISKYVEFSQYENIEKIDARPRLLDDIDQDLVKRLSVRPIDLNRAFEEPRLYRQSWLVMTARG